MQTTGASVVNCTEDELEQCIGMHIKMGVVMLPRYTMYWSNEMRYPPVADVMPRKRFEKLKRHLHFVDNARYDESIGDKLFKMCPVIEGIAEKCRQIAPEESQLMSKSYHPRPNSARLGRTFQKSLVNGSLKTWFELEPLDLCMIFTSMLDRRLDAVEKVATNTSKNLLTLLQGFVRGCLCMQTTMFSLTTDLQRLTCSYICKREDSLFVVQ